MAAANRLFDRVARTHREELATMTAMASQASDAILAYDAGGRQVAFEEAVDFVPPPQAVRVRVNIGLELEREIAL